MKKYSKPVTEVIELNTKMTLLQASGLNNQYSPEPQLSREMDDLLLEE